MPDLKIGGMSPNLPMVLIGIVTVAYGKLRAFWVGCAFGLMTEIMMPSISFFNLALYSLSSLFCSFLFADKPLQRIEYERALNRKHRELSPLTRTFLCVLTNAFVFEIFNVGYIYISGTEIELNHIMRAVTVILSTGALAILIMLPLRRMIFGIWDQPALFRGIRNRLRGTRA